jgi:outer membrane protein assembly factor BamB
MRVSTGFIASLSVATFMAGCHGSAGAPTAALPSAGAELTMATSTTLAERSAVRRSGDIIITDQFNNRVIQIDRNHSTDWHFGNGSSIPGPNSIVGPNDAERFGAFTLIAGTGAPGGTEPACPPPNGCIDNRVILVNAIGKIVWQYGQAGVTGFGFNQLSVPVFAIRLPNGHYMIVDQSNERVIEVTRDKHIVWQYGMNGVSGSGFDQLNNPNSALLLENGHVLIADENNNRVIEVDKNTKQIVWHYGVAPPATSPLSGAAFASRLENGNTLITDSNNGRIVEIDRNGDVEWQYFTNRRPGSITLDLPTRAVRLRNGDTLIADQFNDQVIEVNRMKQIVFTQGQIGAPGAFHGRLNAPYSANVIGDFTGLTPPRNDDEDDSGEK